MTFLPGLRRSGFCGQQVAVLLHSVAGPVFPVLSRFNKMTGSLFPQAAAGFVLFSSACAGWLIQTASEPSESPL